MLINYQRNNAERKLTLLTCEVSKESEIIEAGLDLLS